MPELENLLDFSQKLRLAVALRKPHVIGKLLAEVANDTRNDRAEMAQIYMEVANAVRETYGSDGLEKFERAYNRFTR